MENSPVELVVVIVRLPPEVGPDEQQEEGEEEDERPQKLPLFVKEERKKNTQSFLDFCHVVLGNN